MGSSGKPRWKRLSSLYHRSPATTTPPPAEPPREFICPISGRLMADPVILPSGQTFERGCAQAFKDLGVVPPGAGAGPGATDLLIIPNMALKTAIHNWCSAIGHEQPQPIDPAAALHLVRGHSTSSHSCSATSCSTTNATASASSSSSSEISSYVSQSPPKSASSAGSFPLEEEILAGLGSPRIPPQETALLLLRSATRDGCGDTRAALCTPKLLAALRPALLSRHPSLQSHAAASLVNLSLHPPNRAAVVRAGLVPALVDVLKGGGVDAQSHAAAALFSLAVDNDNKAAVGALGALPPLLHLISRPSGSERARQDAAMALYHLSMAGTNRSKLLKLGAVRTLLGLAAGASAVAEVGPALPTVALKILCNLAASGEGRAAMMEVGAVEALVRLLGASSPPAGHDAAVEARREHCVAALYWMSRGSMRFRGLAKAAGAEAALRAVVEQEEEGDGDGEDAAENGKSWRTREMARRALRAVVGDDVGGGDAACGGVSEPVLRGRRRTTSGGSSTF